MIFGTLQQPVVLPEYLKGQFPLLGRDFPTYRVFIIAFSAVMIFALWFGVRPAVTPELRAMVEADLVK